MDVFVLPYGRKLWQTHENDRKETSYPNVYLVAGVETQASPLLNPTEAKAS